ncbi:MAG: ABC transporter permease [Clostridia bacterium]|nr:ABC transporter permease [Clostridia bacterium]
MDSRHNLQLANDTYTTIAIMELYADVDSRGNIISDVTKAEDYAGYHALTVYGYDLEPIITAPSVKKYELRARYGAFSKDNIAVKYNDKKQAVPICNEDIIRFKIVPEHQEQAEADKEWNDVEFIDDGRYRIHTFSFVDSDTHTSRKYNLDIIESAINVFDYEKLPILFNISLDNIYTTTPLTDTNSLMPSAEYADKPDCIILEPNTEYIASISGLSSSSNTFNAANSLYKIQTFGVARDKFFRSNYYCYSIGRSEYVSCDYPYENPFWIYEYDELKSKPEMLKKYEQIARAYYINSRSFGVMTTNDLTGIPAFHLGNMFIPEGRMITEEEYASGAKVCMISTDLAKLQGWNVGDKIDFSFYEYNNFVNATIWGSRLSPRYTYTDPDHFFDNGEYEIVGVYNVRPLTGTSAVSASAVSVPWNTIYIPEKSLENAPAEEDRPVTGALLTIWLENGKIEPFIERMNELGITGAKQGDYEARFTFYDQGYSRIQPSLEALSGTAELLLILSSSLLVIAALLLAFFYAQSQKQSIGTMRLLGCSKASAFVAVMLSALIIAVTGALIGAAIGHALTASVGESIMASANQTPEEFLAFSAYLAESTQVEVEFALGADAKVSLLTCLAALGLFIAGTLVFVLRYLGKGPRELLPRAGE